MFTEEQRGKIRGRVAAGESQASLARELGVSHSLIQLIAPLGRQRARIIEWRGERLSVTEWAKRLRLDRGTLTRRIGKLGIELALSTPGSAGSERPNGNKKHPLYQRWKSMLKRCRNPRAREYSHYGGRGIRVCETWTKSFQAFATDVGLPPSDAHELDRRDNDGNYEPSNIRWVTKTEQVRNRRLTLRVEWQGAVIPLALLAERTGVSYYALRRRIFKAGWSVDAAVRGTA